MKFFWLGVGWGEVRGFNGCLYYKTKKGFTSSGGGPLKKVVIFVAEDVVFVFFPNPKLLNNQ